MRTLFAVLSLCALVACEPAYAATWRHAALEHAAQRIVAERHHGLHGFLGAAQSSSLLARAQRDIGRNPTGWSRQWCGRQMSLWAGGGSNLAADWRHYGQPSAPRPGVIGVMPHHVGVVESVQGDYVILISGNHSGPKGRRVVGTGKYPISKFIAFRAP